LDDIEMLEQYVQMSMSTLIFLSRGYFVSKNCLREAESATALNSGAHLLGFKPKPIILVHEADLNHGGAPLSALKAECPEELRAPIFAERVIVPWLRIGHLQKQTLCIIAKQMLLAAPKYQKLDAESLDVFMPEAITEFDWKLPHPVVLFASPNNPGAKALAAQIAEPPTKQLGIGGHLRGSFSVSYASGRAIEQQIREGVPTHGVAAGKSAPERAKMAMMNRRQPVPKSSRLSAYMLSANTLLRARTWSSQQTLSLFIGGHPKPKPKPKARPDRDRPVPVQFGATAADTTDPTHFLLLLNKDTFVGDKGEALAHEVRAARALGIALLMIHETDEARGGCAFDHFFHVTPPDLVKSGLYRQMAIAWHQGEHLCVSRARAAEVLGGERCLPSALTDQDARTSSRAPSDSRTSTPDPRQNL
jgi:hypothetical protein